jgi:hypothetical protein
MLSGRLLEGDVAMIATKAPRIARSYAERRLRDGASRETVATELMERGWASTQPAGDIVNDAVKELARQEELRLQYLPLYKAWATDRLALSVLSIAGGILLIAVEMDVFGQLVNGARLATLVCMLGLVYYGVRHLGGALFAALAYLSLAGKSSGHARARRALAMLATPVQQDRLRLKQPRELFYTPSRRTYRR